MRKEITIAVFGIVLLAAVFLSQPGVLQHSSPLALFFMVILGLILSLKFKLPGSTLLFFGGAALTVHPLLFSSSLWLLPGALLSAFAGIIVFIKWWKQNGR